MHRPDMIGMVGSATPPSGAAVEDIVQELEALQSRCRFLFVPASREAVRYEVEARFNELIESVRTLGG